MAQKTIGIIMNGVTGRMGYRQHLVRSILAIREQGGVLLADGERVQVEPVLVGRNAAKLAELAAAARHRRLDHRPRRRARRPRWQIYFDFQVTKARAAAIRKAIAAGKAIYTEKPTAESLEEALELAAPRAEAAGVKNGVVHDKLYLPGLLQAASGWSTAASSAGSCRCAASSATGCSRATGRPRSGRAGTTAPRTAAASSSTCSRTGTTCWRTCSAGSSRSTRSAVTHIPQRVDEAGQPYAATADDAAYAIFELDGRRDRADQLLLGRARRPRRAGRVPGRRHPRQRGRRAARLPDPAARRHPEAGVEPRPRRRPTTTAPTGTRCPTTTAFDNGFKTQWEQFLRHVVEDAPHPYDFLAGARGVRLAEPGLRVARARAARVDLPELTLPTP